MGKILRIGILLAALQAWAQPIALYHQVNGHYDFTFIGNTLNPSENGLQPFFCYTLPQSSAALNLSAGDAVESAFLYWAGSGPGDFDVTLNGQDITASRTFGLVQTGSGLPFFAAFADVTPLVQATGNGTYTLSGLDISDVIDDNTYCNNGTNFAGWAICIVYGNPSLPLNQVQVFDGLDFVTQGHNQINITLAPLNVIDNTNAKIGFIAWEGDAFIANNESLRVNNVLMSNALNPANNAFNGTNSITGATNLYNMDLDVYDVQGAIAIGDTQADIQLTSDQDFVMVNTIVTKFNSQLPDATIAAGNVDRSCGSRTFELHYTVSNLNASEVLPAAVPIAFYSGGQLIGTAQTSAAIAVGGSEDGVITLTLPGTDTHPQVTIVVDDDGTGHGHVIELLENNNTATATIDLLIPPLYNQVPPRVSCNLGLGRAHFDFSNYADLIKTNPSDAVTFYESADDAASAVSPILNISDYTADQTPHEIFARIDDGTCASVASFMLLSRNCPPTVYNYVSANGDGRNDTFHIDGLYNIFLHFQLSVYNRWGQQVWTGNNNSEEWSGQVTKGVRIGNQNAPDGTYYYLLQLNDIDYPQPLTGFLYLNH